MAKYKAYPEYKTISSSWLDSIPNGWELLPLKYLCNSFVKDGPHETPVFLEEGIPFLSVDGIQDNKLVFEGCRYISPSDHFRFSHKCKPVKGDVLLGKAASIGKVALVDTSREFNVWSPLAVISPIRSCLSKFIYYSLQATMLQAQCEVYSNSNTQKNLGMSTIDNLDFAMPSDEEASSISTFLDHETAKIDNLIEKQKQLIELLKEKRQAVISHAVTNGLNPDVPMKDSGVEWLGKVPEDWQLKQIRHLCTSNGGGTPSKSNPNFWVGNIPWVSPKDMKVQYISDAEDHVSEDAVKQSSTKKIPIGSVLIVVRGMILAHSVPVAINTKVVTINQDMKALVPNGNISCDYLHLVLSGLKRILLELTDNSSHGTKCLRTDLFEKLWIPLPSLKQQKKIISEINEKVIKIDSLIHLQEEAKIILQERRTALISAAVTGKIDVRDWVAPETQDIKEPQEATA